MTLLANPVTIDPTAGFVLGGLLEASIVAWLLCRRGYPGLRVLLWWMGLSIGTFGLLLVPWMLTVARHGRLAAHAVEIPIVIVEGVAAFWLLQAVRRRLTPRPAAVGFGACMAISLAANAASYLTSLALLRG